LQRHLAAGVQHLSWNDPLVGSGRLVRGLEEVIRRERIDVLHAHNRTSARVAVQLRAATGVPIILTAHTMVPYPEYQEADYAIAVSRAAAERYQSHGVCGGQTPEVIYGGVDVEAFRPEPDARASVRAELRLPPLAPLVVTVSRLAKKSNIHCFLETASIVRRLVPEARFAVVGDGPLDARWGALLKRQSLGLKRHVSFLGDRSDVPRLLAAADTFVLCSRQEALGLSLLEAMACRVPVVATDVDGISEALVDGESGLLCPLQPHEVARRIVTLLRAPRTAREMGQAAHRRVCERFNLGEMVERHEQVYRSLLAQR
jgi:glycosyltransferase involved in cell wall biosynthesis